MNAMQPSGAVAYIRKSVRGRDDMDRSRDVQKAAIAALAARDGTTIVRIYDQDWGISASREKRERRRAMTELIEDIQTGTVTALYAYALDRLARDTEHALALWHACKAAGIPIVTDTGRYDTTNGEDRLRYVILMEMAAQDIDKITKRNRDVHARTRVNDGDDGRRRPYGAVCPPGCRRHHDHVWTTQESIGAVVEAYQAAGSFLGAAVKLTGAGVPSRLGRPWSSSAVANIVRRNAPDVAPEIEKIEHRSPPSRTLRFSGLLRCHCGATMLGMTRKHWHTDGSPGVVTISYYCQIGQRDPSHSRPIMRSERIVLDFAIRESLKVKGVILEAPAHRAWADQTVEKLAAKRRLWAQQQEDGILTREEVLAKVAGLKAIETKVTDVRRVETFLGHAVDWDAEPAAINRALRAVWWGIEFGPDMLPARVDWIIDPDDETAIAAREAEIENAPGRGPEREATAMGLTRAEWLEARRQGRPQ